MIRRVAELFTMLTPYFFEIHLSSRREHNDREPPTLLQLLKQCDPNGIDRHHLSNEVGVCHACATTRQDESIAVYNNVLVRPQSAVLACPVVLMKRYRAASARRLGSPAHR